MTRWKKIALFSVAAILVVCGVGMYLVGKNLVTHFESQIREQAILYLRDRFDSEVEMSSLHVAIPALSPIKTFWNKGRGVLARVEGGGLLLRHKGRKDIPPLITLKSFLFEVDLAALLEPKRKIAHITLNGMQISIPPKGSEPRFGSSEKQTPAAGDKTVKRKNFRSVVVEEILVTNARLIILPKDSKKVPLTFDIYNLRLGSAAKDTAMKYEAVLTNPKPAGIILSKGTFGPWAAEAPGDTPLNGDYEFKDADLSVFQGIAGILQSTGHFEGTLSGISATGEARVPDFRLKMSGNPVPLSTRFEVGVDGTNGNTTLKPVYATLGKTQFTVSGGVIKHDGDTQKTISLDARVPKGRLEDFLSLAVKGTPIMQGEISLKTKIEIPPLSGKVKEKLILDGVFKVLEGKFLRTTIQDQIDNLSRRAQGQPKNEKIDEVFARMTGDFHLEGEAITFRSLSFMVPGAAIDLAGNYKMDQDELDFHGNLRLDAKISQTMTGWKHWVAKPLDPFFAKNGAGTFLLIKIDGPPKSPRFGRDRGPKSERPTVQATSASTPAK
jgi:hypothetical protein